MKKQDEEVMKNFHDRFYKPVQKNQPVEHYRPKPEVCLDGKPSKYGFTDPHDLELERRLMELRGPSPVPPSEKELGERFENMKTEQPNPQVAGNNSSNLPTSTRTETEETNDLMKQAEEENRLDQNLKQKDEELSSRLDDLKGREHVSQSPSTTRISAVDGKEPSDDWTGVSEYCKVENSEIKGLMSEAKQLIESEQRTQARDRNFIAEAQSRLGRLNSGSEPVSQPVEGAVGGNEAFTFKWTEPDIDFHGNSDDHDDIDVEIQSLIEQMVAESKLEDKLDRAQIDPYKIRKGEPGPPFEISVHPQSKGLPQATSLPPQQPVSSASNISYPLDELPWCCICNGDAAILCRDCDNDLYCMRCFKQGHEQFSMFGHRYELYEMPEQLLQ